MSFLGQFNTQFICIHQSLFRLFMVAITIFELSNLLYQTISVVRVLKMFFMALSTRVRV